MQPVNRRIYFTPDADGTILFRLEAVGVNDNEILEIVGVTGADLAGGRISLDVRAGQRERVDVVFSEAYDGPLEIALLAPPANREAAP